MSITDPHLSDSFNDKIEEVYNKLLKTFGTLSDGATGLGQCHRQFVTSAVGMFYVLGTFLFSTFYSSVFVYFFLFLSFFLQNVSVLLLSNITLMHRLFVLVLLDTGLKKCKNGIMLVETVQAFEKGEYRAVWCCCLLMLLVKAVFLRL